MAVQYADGPGNNAIVLAGRWNDSTDNTSFTPSFAGATELTVAFTLKPTALSGTVFDCNVNPTTTRRIIHCGTICGGQQTFMVLAMFNTGTLMLRVMDENAECRSGITGPGALVVGQVCRIVWRWRGSPETMKLTVNNVDFPVDFHIAPGGYGGSTVSALRASASVNGSGLEIGYGTGDDWGEVEGIYQEFGIWRTFLSDADTQNYCDTGLVASVVTTTGRCYNPDLSTAEHIPGTPNANSPWIGKVVDRWSGFVYGQATSTYNFGGGPFVQATTGVFNHTGSPMVADLPTGSTEPEFLPDAPSLPRRYFEPYERLGYPGIRSNTNQILVPSQMALQAAIDAAQYGDTIVLDHTQPAQQGFFVMKTKPVTALTPRMPPTGRTSVTGATAISG